VTIQPYSPPPGEVWTPKPTGISGGLTAIEWLNGQFLIGATSSGRIFTSPDGDNLTQRHDISTYHSIQGIAYGNNVYVAVGESGRILTSSNAASWTLQIVTNDPMSFLDVVFAGGQFVAVGAYNGYRSVIYTSADGVNWTDRTIDNGLYLQSIVYANGLFVAVGREGLILTSSDGVNWAPWSSGLNIPGGELKGVAYGDGRFVAAGNAVTTSLDGINWTPQGNPSSYQIAAVAYGNGLFVAVNGGGQVLTSPDGVTWTNRGHVDGVDYFAAVAYGNGRFVAVGYPAAIVAVSV
jgi:hypothetical protein